MTTKFKCLKCNKELNPDEVAEHKCRINKRFTVRYVDVECQKVSYHEIESPFSYGGHGFPTKKKAILEALFDVKGDIENAITERKEYEKQQRLLKKELKKYK